MEFLVELVAGLALAHLIWALFYCTGTFVLGTITRRSEPSVRPVLLEVLVRTALGAALFMFAIFMLGAIGALYRTELVALSILLPGVLFAIGSRRNGLRRTLEALGQPWQTRDIFPFCIYFLAAAVFAPALLAPVEWDSGMYHLAHAVDWANAGHLYVDPYVRLPLFAYNFELLYAAIFALGLGFYVQVVDWLAFLWSALGVYALTLYLISPKLSTTKDVVFSIFGRQFVAFIAACVYGVSPVVLRYVDTAYVDIAIGFFFLATVGAAVMAIDRQRGYALAAAVIGGSFIGMKLQLVAFVPLLVGVLGYVGYVTHSSWKSFMMWLCAFAIIGCPWYVRNLTIAGDPLSPVLNLAFRHWDPYWSQADYAAVLNSLHGGHAPPLLAPLMQFMHPAIFGEAGAPFNVCFMLVPVAVTAVLLFWSRLRTDPFFIACASTAYAACVFYAVSQYLRYSLEFYTVYVAVLAAMIFWTTVTLAKIRAQRVPCAISVSVAASILAATAIPSSAGASPYQSGLTERSFNLSFNVTHPDDYFAASVPAYREVAALSDVIAASGKHGAVLALGTENLAYAFREHGIVSIGDWFGPGRYSDVSKSVDASAMATYLKDFNVSGVLVLQRNIGLSDKENRDFIRQIEAAGFTRLAPLDPGVESYIRTDVRDAAQAAGFRNELLRDVSLVPSTHQPSGPTVPSVEFLKVFDRGKLNSVVPAGTPNGRGVLTLSWPDAQPAITVVSGYNYTFSRVRLGARPILIFDVARAFSRGQSALAWIDITPKVGKTLRLFSAICPPADGTKPRWRHVAVPFPLKNATVNVTFGTSSLPGGGIADWIAYADPVLQDARMQ